jgi:hypothetical protein
MSDNFFDVLPIELFTKIFVYVVSEEENFELLRLVNNTFKSIADEIEQKYGRTIIFTPTKHKNYINSQPSAMNICFIFASYFMTGCAEFENLYCIKTFPNFYTAEFINSNGIKIDVNGKNFWESIQNTPFSYYPDQDQVWKWRRFLPDSLAISHGLSNHRYYRNQLFVYSSLNKTLDYYVNCVENDKNISNTRERETLILWSCLYKNEFWAHYNARLNNITYN